MMFTTIFVLLPSALIMNRFPVIEMIFVQNGCELALNVIRTYRNNGVICCRYDVSKVTRPCLLKACTLQSGAVAALLYTVALCINVSMASMDDRLGPKTNITVDVLRDFPTKEVY